MRFAQEMTIEQRVFRADTAMGAGGASRECGLSLNAKWPVAARP